MKPIKLIMQSFGSYGKKTVIDFTKPEQNLFLVTGDTGSGKSTIFDAIVFALYGETSSNINKKSGRELQSQFSSQDKTFVELTFTEKCGSDIRLYTVRREPRQLKMSVNGKSSFLSEKLTLILPDGTAVSQKEATLKLSEILILTKSQFMQTSMIAQGEFMELLRSSSNDKKKILRKLFNTEIFNKIVDELKLRRKDFSEQLKVITNICYNEVTHIIIPQEYEKTTIDKAKETFLDNEISTYSLDSFLGNLSEFCNTIEKKKVAVENTYNRLLKESEEKNDNLKNARILLKNFEEMEKAKKIISECESSESDINVKYELIYKINSAYDIQSVYNRYEDILKSVESTHEKLENHNKMLPELEKEYDEFIKKEDIAIKDKDLAMAEFIKTSERVKRSFEVFDRIHIIDDSINKRNFEIISENKKLNALNDNISKLESDLLKSQEVLEVLSNSENLFSEWKLKFNEVEHILNNYNEILKLNNNVDLKRKKVNKLQKEYISARQEYSLKINEYTQKRTAFLDEQASFIAMEKLHDGCPCPVCGSLEHPAPCHINDIHTNITREVIDNLAEEVSESDSIQNNKSAQVKAEIELLQELELNLTVNIKSLYENIIKIVPYVSESYDIKQMGSILYELKSNMIEEGKLLSDNVDKYYKESELIQRYTIQKNKLLSGTEIINKSILELDSEISADIKLKNELLDSLFYVDEESAKTALSVVTDIKDKATNNYIAIKKKLDLIYNNLQQTKTTIKKYTEELPELENILLERKKDYINITEKYSIGEWKTVVENYQKSYAEVLQSEIDEYNQKKISATTLYELSLKAIGNNSCPDVVKLENENISAKNNLEISRQSLEFYKDIYKTNIRIYEFLLEQYDNYKYLNNMYENINRLYKRLSGNSSGEHIGIETFIQRYYLQRILDSANIHFRRMSGGQFELRLIDSEQAMSSGRTEMGLEFTVYSMATNSERPVKTLSGGETFISALALALGLSGQIQENISTVNPDIIFIDEGFGSLDEHSRSQAVRVLKEMAQGNRFIGIISHVTEMKQEIDNQLIVTKDKEGSHVHWVIN